MNNGVIYCFIYIYIYIAKSCKIVKSAMYALSKLYFPVAEINTPHNSQSDGYVELVQKRSGGAMSKNAYEEAEVGKYFL